MFTVPIGGFSAIIYMIILLVGRLVRGSRKGTLGPLGRALLHLIDRKHDGPWRRAFAYSVASGIFLMFVGVFGTVMMDEAHSFSTEYPVDKIFHSSVAMAREIGQEMHGVSSNTELNSGLMSTAVCAGVCVDGPK